MTPIDLVFGTDHKMFEASQRSLLSRHQFAARMLAYVFAAVILDGLGLTAYRLLAGVRTLHQTDQRPAAKTAGLMACLVAAPPRRLVASQAATASLAAVLLRLLWAGPPFAKPDSRPPKRCIFIEGNIFSAVWHGSCKIACLLQTASYELDWPTEGHDHSRFSHEVRMIEQRLRNIRLCAIPP